MRQTQDPSGERELARHILPTSGTMIGVCTTLIGLVKVVESRIGPSHVDEYVGLASIFFVVSAIASYFSIRHARRYRFSQAIERLADICFLIGLFAIAVIALLYAYEAI